MFKAFPITFGVNQIVSWICCRNNRNHHHRKFAVHGALGDERTRTI